MAKNRASGKRKQAGGSGALQLEPKANGIEPFAYLQRVLVELPYLGKSPSHEDLEAFMPWAPDIQKDCMIPNSDAYVNAYLE